MSILNPIEETFNDFWDKLIEGNPELTGNETAKSNSRALWFAATGNVLDVLFSTSEPLTGQILSAMAEEYMREAAGITDSSVIICNPPNDDVH